MNDESSIDDKLRKMRSEYGDGKVDLKKVYDDAKSLNIEEAEPISEMGFISEIAKVPLGEWKERYRNTPIEPAEVDPAVGQKVQNVPNYMMNVKSPNVIIKAKVGDKIVEKKVINLKEQFAYVHQERLLNIIKEDTKLTQEEKDALIRENCPIVVSRNGVVETTKDEDTDYLAGFEFD